MSGQYALELGADENPYEITLEKGREQGLEQGVQRGLGQGLAALLFIAESLLTPGELDRFRAQPASTELLNELRLTIAERIKAS